MEKRLELPSSFWGDIKRGDSVLLSGKLYVGRDQAHKRLTESLKRGEAAPFEFEGNGIYYMGPSPSPEGRVIGAAGPTTSARMDAYSPFLIEKGLRIMVGKGPRSQSVVDAIREHGGLYLQAYGGCGALYSKRIISSRTIAYPELGPEAILELEVRDFPLFCLIDSRGDVYSPEP